MAPSSRPQRPYLARKAVGDGADLLGVAGGDRPRGGCVTRDPAPALRAEVGSIYRKLGVSSRTEAVQQATKIGLSGG